MRSSPTVALGLAIFALASLALFLFPDVATSPSALDGGKMQHVGSQGKNESKIAPGYPYQQTDPRPVVEIGGTRVAVSIADTPEERSQGLSGRAPLAENEGMLFIFPEDGKHGFWMKDMRFSIDIIWLSSEDVVVHIEEHVSPESYPASFASQNPARFVLEVPAGFAKTHNIALGSVAVLPR